MRTPQRRQRSRKRRYMPPIAFVVESPLVKDNEDFERVVRAALEALVMVNMGTLATQRIPRLYDSGVRYRREPRGIESFVDLVRVLRRGHGDCAHLAAWRVAELRAGGEHAGLRLKSAQTRRGRLFHVLVRRADGSEEDPSRILGMKGSG